MQRIPTIELEATSGTVRETLDAIKAQRGHIFNLHKVLANSETALNAYHHLLADLAKGALPMPLRNKIAVMIAELHKSVYAIAAFAAISKMGGASDQEIAQARQGVSGEAKTDAALKFAKKVMETRGTVDDTDVAATRDAGWSNAEILEIIVNVATYTLMNYIALVTGIESDFPPVIAK